MEPGRGFTENLNLYIIGPDHYYVALRNVVKFKKATAKVEWIALSSTMITASGIVVKNQFHGKVE